jgi:hypothetical protein
MLFFSRRKTYKNNTYKDFTVDPHFCIYSAICLVNLQLFGYMGIYQKGGIVLD